MSSNSLSSRRGLLRRPKHCFTRPNPGRCEEPPEPPPTITCYVEPAEWTMEVTDEEDVMVHAYHDGLPEGQDIFIVVDEESGSLDIWEGPISGRGNGATYTPEEVGDFTLTVHITFSDDSVCECTALVHVEEEEEPEEPE